jgi:hypothetical protein
MKRRRRMWIFVLSALITGCVEKEVPYGTEATVSLPNKARQTWAVAPTVNLSGESAVDPLLHSDLVFQQMQQVRGLTVIPVNRVAEVYAAMGVDRLQTQEQAAVVCEVLGADGLVVPTVTIYDAYNPPKLGAALQLFKPKGVIAAKAGLSPREIARQAAPSVDEAPPVQVAFVQVVGMFDAANGSTRADLEYYAAGRYEPKGPLGVKEYFVNMDRYCGFVYHTLIRELLKKQAAKG